MPEPLLSVATATHDPKFLGALAQSLKEQTFGRYELVILANGPVTDAEIESKIPPVVLEKTRIVRAPEGTPSNVGAVKKLAFEAALTELVVEADHDDILAPNCLERVWDEYRRTDADFLYSDMAIIEGESLEDHGIAAWPSHCHAGLYETMVSGTKRLAHRVVPVGPHFFFAVNIGGPCHVRAWKKSFYEKVGGHRSDFTISDDYELITRCYIEGAKFHHIPECLYLYRCLVGNTSNVRGKTGDEARWEFANYYRPMVPQVLKRWANDAGLLGAGTPAEVEAAFKDGKPGTFGYIVADDSFAGIADQEKFLDRAHELLAHGGWLAAGSKSWNQEALVRRTRPSLRPPANRYQEMEIWAEFDRKEGEPIRMDQFRRLSCFLIKKEAGKTLPGKDYWESKPDPWIDRKFRPVFAEAGAQLVQKEGRYEVYGGEVAQSLAESANAEHPGLFVYRGPRTGTALPEDITAKRIDGDILKNSPGQLFHVILWDKQNRQVELTMKVWGLETLVQHLLVLAPRRGYERFVILDGTGTKMLFEYDIDKFDRMLEKALPARTIELAKFIESRGRDGHVGARKQKVR